MLPTNLLVSTGLINASKPTWSIHSHHHLLLSSLFLMLTWASQVAIVVKNPGESHGRGTWWATVHRITKSWTRLKRLST